MDAKVLWVLALFALTEADFGSPSSTLPQRFLKDIVHKRTQLNYLKVLLQDLDDKFEKLEKRSCTLSLPGEICGEIKGLGKDNSHWKSEMSPGKKRSQRLPASRRGSTSTSSVVEFEREEAPQQDESLTIFAIQ